jgi:hypothetical protein
VLAGAKATSLGDFDCMAAKYRDVVTAAKATEISKATVKVMKAARGLKHI